MFFGEKCFKAPNGGLFCYSKFENLALKKCRHLGLFWACDVYIFTGMLHTDNHAHTKN